MLKPSVRTIASTTLCAAVLMSMAACGQGGGSSSSAAGGARTTTAAATTDSTATETTAASGEGSARTTDRVTKGATFVTTKSPTKQTKATTRTPTKTVAPTKAPPLTPRTISRVVEQNGRRVVQVGSEPYLMYGIQIRLDDAWPTSIRLNPKKREVFYQKAAEAGFKTVQIVVGWRSIEPKQDAYSFTGVKEIIDAAGKYGLRVQLLWFGSNVGGYANAAPEYVFADRKTYPVNPKWPDNKMLLKLDAPALMEREAKALTKLMEYLNGYDKDGRVIMIQINNESDGVANMGTVPWSDKDKEIDYLCQGGQMAGNLTQLDYLGKAVQNSVYKIVTRHNMTTEPFWNPHMMNYADGQSYYDKMNALKGIDLIGIDIYAKDAPTIRKFLDLIDLPGNMKHIAESGPQHAAAVNMALTAFDEGAGFLYYELKTSDGRDYDLGLYRKDAIDWIERDGTQAVGGEFSAEKESSTAEIKAFNAMIYKADAYLATLPGERITAFNMDNVDKDYDSGNVACGGYSLRYRSASGSEALAMCTMEGDLILLSLYDGQFTIDGKTVTGTVSAGHFTGTTWTGEGSAAVSGNTVTMKAGMCVRIPAAQLKG